ncbi:hypothetical protein KI387_041988, partial [Taxus chinensis]
PAYTQAPSQQIPHQVSPRMPGYSSYHPINQQMNPPLTPQQHPPFASYVGHASAPPQSDMVQILFKKITDLEASTKGARPSYSFEE